MTIAEKPMNVIPSMPIVCRKGAPANSTTVLFIGSSISSCSKLGAAVHVDSVAGDPARIV